MKTLKTVSLRTFLTLLIMNAVIAISYAQDSSGGTVTSTERSSVTTTTETTEWYTAPWVWIVGGILFILLLVALLRGGSKDSNKATDKVTYTKTVSSDRE